MSDFAGMEELLQDFLQESGDLLSDVDSKLIVLEKAPDDRSILNDIFRGFHTIKGGAGFLNAAELVSLCHLTENLFDKLRNGELAIDTGIMDVILTATGEVRNMFGALERGVQPDPAPGGLIAALKQALSGQPVSAGAAGPVASSAPAPVSAPAAQAAAPVTLQKGGMPDWEAFYRAITGQPPLAASAPSTAQAQAAPRAGTPYGRRDADKPAPAPAGRREGDAPQKENTIRVDTERLDQVLTLSGEIGLTKNRLTRLRTELMAGTLQQGSLKALDEAVNQLDMLVVNLQNSVMKTRMQPVGRLFKKFPRLARDLARQLGKDVELELHGEDTEIDKTMLEDLNDPLVHLIRNAVDHGVEETDKRLAAGKSGKSIVKLSAQHESDHVLIRLLDDGKGMNPEVIRNKAVEKGLIAQDQANALSESQCLELIFLPGFSTKDQISSVSGRGVGMDVVKTNIQKLNGRISIISEPGSGSEFVIELPLTLAILPVLMLRLGSQCFAIPMSVVSEILSIEAGDIKQVGGKETMLIRGEVIPVFHLAQMIGWEQPSRPEVGVLMNVNKRSLILTADWFEGHDDVVIKPLETFKPRGVAGVTMSSDGEIVLILDLNEVLGVSSA